MEVSYNLRYQKSSFSGKLLLDKEGEVIVYSKGFRLKGKGANDRGTLINFSEIKEFYHRNEKIFFVTFTKEKYVLMDAGTLYDQLLIDIYKARNAFLIDALFMKRGKLKAEFDCDFQRLSKFGKMINKGDARIKLFEKSMVIVPPEQDAFAIHFDFVNFHEFDDAEYTLKIVMEDGVTLLVSGLGNDFDTFHEKINQLLGGMYETLVNEFLKEVFPHFHVATLLKLGFKMRGGKAVSQKDVEKMDKELASAIDDFIFENEDFKAKTQVLRDETDEYGVFYGIAQDEKIEGSYVKWTMFAVPNHNIVGFSILPRWKQGGEDQEEERYPDDMYFFKIIMEKGTPAEKVEDKVREINQALVILNFVKDPCYQDKRELKHSPYQYAIRKLPFLRILRKSYIGKASSKEVGEWHKQVKEVFKNAALK